MTRATRGTVLVAGLALVGVWTLAAQAPLPLQAKVRQRLDELTRQGWSLPLYREQILADAAGVRF
jgi:hypothetical protein